MKVTCLLFPALMLLVCVCGGGLVSGQATTSSSGGHHEYRTVCYVAGWAHYRLDPVQYHPEDVDTSLCTHLIFAFAALHKTGLHLIPKDPVSDKEMYQRLVGLKTERPDLRVMLSVGGWDMGSNEFTVLVSSTANMHAFASRVVYFLRHYNFDGLDVDWEFPADRGSPAGDKQRFTDLLKILKQEFITEHNRTRRTRLELSAVISPSPYRINMSYELPEIANYVDFLNLMTYDMHGSWESTLGHHSTLYSPSQDKTDSIDYMINWILNTTVPRQKLNLGLPFYGISLNLSDPHNTQLGAPITGKAPGGDLMGVTGTMAYYEVCKLLTEHADTVTDSGRLPGSQAPYVVDGSRWTGYDDVESIKEKVDYVVQHGLGGVMIWSLDMDDFHGICGGGHYPLMHAIKQQFHEAPIGR